MPPLAVFVRLVAVCASLEWEFKMPSVCMYRHSPQFRDVKVALAMYLP